MFNLGRFFKRTPVVGPATDVPFDVNSTCETNADHRHEVARDFATEAALVTAFGSSSGEIVNLYAVEGSHFGDEPHPRGRRTA